MSYDPRTIAFLAEIIFPPQQLAADAVQNIHNALFQQPEISYQNFQVAPDGIHLSNAVDTPGAVSSASFTPDRLILREELRATTLEDFATRVVNVAGIAMETLKIQVSLAQQFAIRSLITPRNVPDSRVFLAERTLSGGPEAIARFGRPLESLGLRLTFPQAEEHREVFNLRIETWTQDPRSLWIENVGSFTEPVPVAEIPKLSTQLNRSYKFLTGPVCEYIASFDTP